jgi:hypothetical protein
MCGRSREAGARAAGRRARIRDACAAIGIELMDLIEFEQSGGISR